MLADFEHSAALPYKSVIWFLQRWFFFVKQGQQGVRNLTLVLECDKYTENVIKDFMQTGIHTGPRDLAVHTSLEMLEFYEDLRSINMEILNFNQVASESMRVSFDVIGAEPPQDFEGVYTRKNQREGFKIFCRTRDRLCAERVIEYAKAHPTSRFLFFYGGAHLQRGLRNKDMWGFFPDEVWKDYYLIHFMEEHYGKENVFSAQQRDFHPKRITGHAKVCEYLTGKTSTSSVFLHSNFVENLVSKAFFGDRFDDAIIVRRAALSPPIPLSAIPLRQIVQLGIDRLGQLESANGYHANREKSFLYDSLQLATRQEFRSYSDWKGWFEKGDFKSWTETEDHISIPGEFPWTGSEKRKELYKKLFLFSEKDFQDPASIVTLRKLSIINCIGTMWLGSPSDKAHAKRILLEETNLDAETPGLYLAWLRKNLYRRNY